MLNRFSDDQWSPGDREVPNSQTADGSMPGLVGVSAVFTRRNYDYRLEGDRGFRSSWLPTTQRVSRVEAPGDWRYDVSTMDFLAGDDDLDTSQRNWTFEAVEVEYDVNRLAEAPPVGALVSREFTDLPAGLDPIVRKWANEVTADAPTRYEKAVALQQWFRDNFEYSTDVDLGNGADDLVRFLSEGEGGRTGDREQFAAAMAVMARELRIPARVAVGFLQPEQVDDDTWVYSYTTCTPGPSCSSPGRAGCESSPRRPPGPVESRTTRSKRSPSETPRPHRRRPASAPARSPRAGRMTPRRTRRPRTRPTASPTAVASPVVEVRSQPHAVASCSPSRRSTTKTTWSLSTMRRRPALSSVSQGSPDLRTHAAPAALFIWMSTFEGSNSAPEYPTAARMRPQFGSRPKTALLTSGLFVTEREPCARHRERAFSTRTSRSVVAPSPSRAIFFASVSHTR